MDECTFKPKINEDKSFRDRSVTISERLYTLEPFQRKEELRQMVK